MPVKKWCPITIHGISRRTGGKVVLTADVVEKDTKGRPIIEHNGHAWVVGKTNVYRIGPSAARPPGSGENAAQKSHTKKFVLMEIESVKKVGC